ncbi:hypothetical protein PS627_02058 [Pseudomonas fluorescens]|uniref:DUF4917 family protein n=1 Tax=Pseudomonas fluorescens TaxID=294 RepID=UPI00125B7633|nr:DUF4917 family protein [Pseudomonas fluorescens]CAG8866697.1 hypothetical protein PS627_02058 [Pseudomonas fluorescens]VVP90130.1 hypothetical protein PS910_02798 [Pseudomonas fluorescens]
MPDATLDANLSTWTGLNDSHPCRALLLGNGVSRAVWKPFGYFSLFEQAQQVRSRALGKSDQALFKALATELFEPVLSMLNTTVRTNAALAISSTAPLNRYYAIKEALIHAMRSLHVPFALMPTPTLQALSTELRNYDRVFTSNYDLLCPWAVEHSPQGFARLFDEEGYFDVRATGDQGTRLHYLHGGLHLLKQADGTTRQRSAEGSELLDGFAVNTPGDVPLFINESASGDKLRAIRNSDYLSWCLGELARDCEGLCVFGQHLGSSDQHLVEAIRQARPAHLAIAIRPLGEASIISQKQRYVEAFREAPELPLYFFDASTHPLGDSGWQISVPANYGKRH